MDPVDKDAVIADLAKALLNVSQTLQQEGNFMALGQNILDAVSAEATVIDSIIVLIKSLAGNTIPQAQADAIVAAISANKAKLEQAILDNTPQGP